MQVCRVSRRAQVGFDCSLNLSASGRQNSFPFSWLDNQSLAQPRQCLLLRLIVGCSRLLPTGIEGEHSERTLQLNWMQVGDKFLHDGLAAEYPGSQDLQEVRERGSSCMPLVGGTRIIERKGHDWNRRIVARPALRRGLLFREAPDRKIRNKPAVGVIAHRRRLAA